MLPGPTHDAELPFVVLAAQQHRLPFQSIEFAIPEQARRTAQNRVTLRFARYAGDQPVDSTAAKPARFPLDCSGRTVNPLQTSSCGPSGHRR